MAFLCAKELKNEGREGKEMEKKKGGKEEKKGGRWERLE